MHSYGIAFKRVGKSKKDFSLIHTSHNTPANKYYLLFRNFFDLHLHFTLYKIFGNNFN